MTKERLKGIRRLEKENEELKELLIEKELKIKMQQEIIKKKATTVGEKKAVVRRYVSKGLKVEVALGIIELSRNQYCHKRKKGQSGPGRPVSNYTD